MNIFKNLNFISSSIDIEPVFISDECMVCPGFGNLVLWTVKWLSNFIPFFCADFILEKVVEVCSSFSCVATKEIKAISIRNSSCSRSCLRLTINKLLLLCQISLRLSKLIICLLVHSHWIRVSLSIKLIDSIIYMHISSSLI